MDPIHIPFALGSAACEYRFIADAVPLIRYVGPSSITIHGSVCPTPLFKPETIKAHENNIGLAIHRAAYVVACMIAAGIPESRIRIVTASPAGSMPLDEYMKARCVIVSFDA